MSSTYYDLRHIRSNIELFVSELGYEAVLFENGSVAFDPDAALDESCYEEVRSCDVFVLIIGGRYGSIASSESGLVEKLDAKSLEKAVSSLNSVTKKEYETARAKDIPIYIFVEKAVASEYRTYLRNKDKKDIQYAHVEHVGVFKLLMEIYAQAKNNLVREFERSSDIEVWLRTQWAGLFASLLRSRAEQRNLQEMAAQLNELRALNEGLKNYSESIMKKLQVQGAAEEIKTTDSKIKQARLEGFLESPMIGWIVGRASKNGVAIRINQWADKFVAASSIEEFLEAVGFSVDQISDMQDSHGQLLERDFVRYKSRYFGLGKESSRSESRRVAQDRPAVASKRSSEKKGVKLSGAEGGRTSAAAGRKHALVLSQSAKSVKKKVVRRK